MSHPQLLRPFKALFWAAAESSIKSRFGLTGPLVPPVRITKDVFYGAQILDGRWNTKVQVGVVIASLGMCVHVFMCTCATKGAGLRQW